VGGGRLISIYQLSNLKLGEFEEMVKQLTLLFMKASLSIIFICLVAIVQAGEKKLEKKRILVLQSYHRGMNWADSVESGVRTFFKESSMDTELVIEYMDTKRHSSSINLKLLRDIYQHRYKDTTFDCLISVDDNALNFLAKYRDELFPGVPVVFCGVNHYNPEKIREMGNTTGVIEAWDAQSTINAAKSLQPDLKNLYIVNDKTATGQANKIVLDSVVSTTGLNHTYMTNYSMQELLAELHKLPENSMVLLMSFNRDRLGQVYSYEDGADKIAKASISPVYGVWGFYLNHGITGGRVTSGVTQGETAAKQALRILKGTSINTIEVVTESPNRYIYDYNVLTKFELNPDLLPAMSSIINEPFSFYAEYRDIILSVIAVFCGYTILLIALIVLIGRTKSQALEIGTNEKKYRTTLNSIGDAVIAVDVDGNVTTLNPIAESLTGWDSESACGQPMETVFNIINSTTRKEVENPVKKVLETGRIVGLANHTILIARDGKEHQIADSAAPISNDEGSITGVVLVFRNVTEEYAIQEELREKSFLVEYAAGPIARASLDRIIRYVNPAFLNMWGYNNVNEVIGRPITDFWLINDRIDGIIQTISTQGSTSEEADAIRGDGSTFTVKTSAAMVFDETGTPIGLVASSADITQRKQAEDKLKEAQNYINCIVDSMPSMLVGVDSNLAVTRWNKGAHNMSGITAGDALGKKVTTLLPYLSDEIATISAVIEQQIVQPTAKRIFVDGEHSMYKEVAVYPLISEDLQGAVIRIDNITERVQLENIMMQTEKMTSVAGLAAGMAHEINNPLAVITQGIQTTQRRLDSSIGKNREAAEKYSIDLDVLNQFLEERRINMFLNGARDGVERAAKIVKNMLMFSRKSDSSKEKIDLAKLVDHTIELGASDYNMKNKYDFKFVEITKEYDEGLPDVLCSSGEMEQVFLNLFKNALQAMEDIETPDFTPKFSISISKEREYARIDITDNGPGIPDDVKGRIFEPFFTTKQPGKGTGLGLSVSYMIVTQNHGGRFEVESELGKGTTFTVKIPMHEQLT